MMQSLLPYNATSFERTVEQAIKFKLIPEILAGFKFRTEGDNINLALSWEYSLSQINVDEFRERVIQGLRFHRLRGTPSALTQILTWYNLSGLVIEETQPGRHFYEFQIGFDTVPNGFDSLTVVQAAKLAAPLRSRIVRMYNKEYDVRKFILNQSDWGDLLGDYSGVDVYNNGVKLSFGRKTFHFSEFSGYSGRYHAKSSKDSYVKNDDRFILGQSKLGDILNRKYGYNFFYNERSILNTDYIGEHQPINTIRPRTIARAQIILSESVLGELNSCFAGSYEHIEEEPFILSFSYLSENRVTHETIPIYRRKWSQHKIEFEYTYESTVTSIVHSEIVAFLGQLSPNIARHCTDSVVCAGRYLGNNTWSDHRHFNVPWTEQAFYTEMNEEE